MMKRISICVLFLLLQLLCAQAQELVHNASYPDDPAFVPLPENERGTVIDFEMDNSEIYPGTVRQVSVYVPKQYDGSTPAALLVCMDGILYDAVTVMDNLIASGEMPVAIGLFIKPGVIKDENGNPLRYNRSNEFDRTDGKWAMFIEKEVIPAAEALVLKDGRKIIISRDANDRAITGASSGGIAAFTAAWERPDLFSRVYCSVGTFVAMRGGNDYPALIRKYEPKPLRIFLQDGMKDAWNPLFGEWWEYNLLMESALDFAGYEVNYKWDRGGHGIYHGTKVFPDAMRWLWRGWPARVRKGNSRNDFLKEILLPESDWEECGSMTVAAPDSAFYPGGRILAKIEKNSNWVLQYIVGKEGALSFGQQYYWLHNPYNFTVGDTISSSMAFDEAGNLYVATPCGVQVCDQNGRVRVILSLPYGKIEALYYNGDRLVVKCGGRVFSRRMKNRAATPSSPVPPSQGMG